ncbi:dihydrolipoyl dehydrogenase [Salinisphaera hydrothermalis]|uniref:dihydrolipoyl dehydrogenase n=1 Tax=Salinisphaera hydrothermalis TaxID=563188 RepID=UPI0033415D97
MANTTSEMPNNDATRDPAKPRAETSNSAQAQGAAEKLVAGEPDHSDCDVVVIGAGPGGYTAAFRAADLGLKTILVERYGTLGGVCLNVGCIPSKALLHVGHIVDTAEQLRHQGVVFARPTIELDQLRDWKSGVVTKLTGGLAIMAGKRQVQTLSGWATFTGPHALKIQDEQGERSVTFKHAIIAAGSRPIVPAGMDLDDPRVMNSTDALELEEIPKRLLVIGGGIIGLEMATVYDALGSKVTVVELMDRIMPDADRDILRPFEKRIRARYENIFTGTRVTGMEAKEGGIKVSFEGSDAPARDLFDRVLVAAGRRPNGDRVNAAAAGLDMEQGFIPVDDQQRTGVAHIFAVGDITGPPMLAHKATHEGKVAAEIIAGHDSAFEATAIPSVAYTDPEVAWVGLTERSANEQGIRVEKSVFPWAASGRALAMSREEGMTKLLFDPDTGRVVGGAIVGVGAGDLIAEVAHAIEMGSTAPDIGLTVHPHPTLSETVALAAEVAEGTVTDLYVPRSDGVEAG